MLLQSWLSGSFGLVCSCAPREGFGFGLWALGFGFGVWALVCGRHVLVVLVLRRASGSARTKAEALKFHRGAGPVPQLPMI